MSDLDALGLDEQVVHRGIQPPALRDADVVRAAEGVYNDLYGVDRVTDLLVQGLVGAALYGHPTRRWWRGSARHLCSGGRL